MSPPAETLGCRSSSIAAAECHRSSPMRGHRRVTSIALPRTPGPSALGTPSHTLFRQPARAVRSVSRRAAPAATRGAPAPSGRFRGAATPARSRRAARARTGASPCADAAGPDRGSAVRLLPGRADPRRSCGGRYGASEPARDRPRFAAPGRGAHGPSPARGSRRPRCRTAAARRIRRAPCDRGKRRAGAPSRSRCVGAPRAGCGGDLRDSSRVRGTRSGRIASA